MITTQHLSEKTGTAHSPADTARAAPLADTRGPAGISRAIADTIRTALSAHQPANVIDERIKSAFAVGEPLALW